MTLRQAQLYPGGHGRGLQSKPETLGIIRSQDAVADSRQRLKEYLPHFQNSELKTWLPSVKSLVRENDPQLFFEDLLTLARDLDRGGHTPTAMVLWEEVRHQEYCLELAEAAQSDLELASGGGPLGARLERQIASLPDQILDGPTLAGMLVGGMAYRFSRGALLKWLLPTGTGLSLPQSLAVRGAASLGGLTFETPIFVGVAHALNPQEGFEARSAMAHAALTLGSLRSFGFLAQSLGRIPVLTKHLGSQGSTLLANLGMLGGIATAESLSRTWELHPMGDPMPLGLQTFITYIQFKGAGALYHRLSPKGLRAWEAQQDQRLENTLQRPVDFWNFPGEALKAPDLLLAAVGKIPEPLLEASPNDPLVDSRPMFMTGTDSKGIPIGKYSTRVVEFLRYLPEPCRSMAMEIDEKMVHPNTAKRLGFLDTLVAGTPKDLRLMNPLEYRLPLIRLWWIVEHHDLPMRHGGYFPWITKIWLFHALADRDVQGVNGLLDRLAGGGDLQETERFFAKNLKDAEIPPYHDFKWRWGDSFITKYDQLIRGIGLGEQSNNILIRMGQWVEQSPEDANPFLFNYHQLLFGLDFFLGRTGGAQKTTIEEILHQLPTQPLAKWRLLRLHQLTYFNERDPFAPSKIAELADISIKLDGDPQNKSSLAPAEILDSQWDAYMGEKGPHLWMPWAMSEAKDWMEPSVEREHRDQRQDKLIQFLWGRTQDFTSLTSTEWAQAFRYLEDPISLEVAKVLDSGRLPLEVLHEEAYRTRLDELLESARQKAMEALPENVRSIPPEVREMSQKLKARFLERTLGPQSSPPEDLLGPRLSLAHYLFGREGDLPEILLVRIPSNETRTLGDRAENLFQLMAAMVHECRHHVDLNGKAAFDTFSEKVVTEMNAHTLEALWRARHGDTDKLRHHVIFSNRGVALQLRDHLEYNRLLY